MDRYARPPSPGSRRLAQPGRSSTGTLVYPSSFDAYYPPARSNSIISGPRATTERVIAPRLTSSAYKDMAPVRPIRDDYRSRPRKLTLEQDPLPPRRPLSVVQTSLPSRNRPVVTSVIDTPTSPLAKSQRARNDESYYLVPSSSTSRREHRHSYSLGNADTTRLTTGEKDPRDRPDRGGYYRNAGAGSGRTGYNMNAPVMRLPHEKEDRTYSYDYNDRREHIAEPGPRPRRDSYNAGKRERPLSIVGLEDTFPRMPISAREAGPPVSERQFDRIARASSVRHNDRHRDDDSLSGEYYGGRMNDDFESGRRPRSVRPPVALHQGPDDTYLPYNGDRNEPYDVPNRKSHKPSTDDEISRRGYGHREEAKARETWDDQYDKYEEPPRRSQEKTNPRDIDEIKDPKPRDEIYVENAHNRTRYSDESRDHRVREGGYGVKLPDKGRRDEDVADRKIRDAVHRERGPDRFNEYEKGSERRKRDEGSLERYDRDDSKLDNGLLVGAAGLAAAGAAIEGARHRNPQDKVSRDTESRDQKDPRERLRESDHDRLPVPVDPFENNSHGDHSGDVSEEDRRDRRRRRRKEKEAREEEDQLRASGELALPKHVREQGSYERDKRERFDTDVIHSKSGKREVEDRSDAFEESEFLETNAREGRNSRGERGEKHGRGDTLDNVGTVDRRDIIEEPRRRRRHHRRDESRVSYSDDSSSHEATETRPTQVRVVTPSQEKMEAEQPRRGILRPPREKFPEDPAPVREGVAPLKDAGKKGVPVNARWTKIDRKLVNPEALDAGNERYEERVDCVIVLRVLTKEEIQAYAAKTQEIRGQRLQSAQGHDSH